jgi:hypothetical protein
MALDKDELGLLLYNAREAFCNKTYEELINMYGDLNGVRLAAAKADAEAIINHFKANGVIMPTALIAPEHAGPVTGTGKIE